MTYRKTRTSYIQYQRDVQLSKSFPRHFLYQRYLNESRDWSSTSITQRMNGLHDCAVLNNGQNRNPTLICEKSFVEDYNEVIKSIGL